MPKVSKALVSTLSSGIQQDLWAFGSLLFTWLLCTLKLPYLILYFAWFHSALSTSSLNFDMSYDTTGVPQIVTLPSVKSTDGSLRVNAQSWLFWWLNTEPINCYLSKHIQFDSKLLNISKCIGHKCY